MCKQLYNLGYGGVGECSQISPEVQNMTVFQRLGSNFRRGHPFTHTKKIRTALPLNVII